MPENSTWNEIDSTYLTPLCELVRSILKENDLLHRMNADLQLRVASLESEINNLRKNTGDN